MDTGVALLLVVLLLVFLRLGVVKEEGDDKMVLGGFVFVTGVAGVVIVGVSNLLGGSRAVNLGRLLGVGGIYPAAARARSRKAAAVVFVAANITVLLMILFLLFCRLLDDGVVFVGIFDIGANEDDL